MTADAALEPRTANEAMKIFRIKPMSKMRSKNFLLILWIGEWKFEKRQLASSGSRCAGKIDFQGQTQLSLSISKAAAKPTTEMRITNDPLKHLSCGG